MLRESLLHFMDILKIYSIRVHCITVKLTVIEVTELFSNNIFLHTLMHQQGAALPQSPINSDGKDLGLYFNKTNHQVSLLILNICLTSCLLSGLTFNKYLCEPSTN